MEFELDKIIKESVSLILEGAETRNMKLAKHYLYDNYGYNEEKAMRVIGSIKTDIPNVRLAKCKFILGITRMLMVGELSNAEQIMGINKSLKYIASDAHINEYDNDLNGMHCNDLIERFSSVAQADMENDKNELSQMEYGNNNNYDIVRIPDFETAEQYGEYTDWCVTHYSDMYCNYTHNGMGIFYFCLKHGFEDVERKDGENCPLDEYGLSMIAVSVNEDGSCNTITCRWNHDNGGNDNIMSPKELSQIIGRNFYDVFIPRSPEEIEERRKKIVKSFIDYAYGAWEEFEDSYYDVENCSNETDIELCYDNEYEEDYEGEYYDENGELCDTNDEYDSGYNYKRTHVKYAIIGASFGDDGEVYEPNYNDDTYYMVFSVSYGSITPIVEEYFMNIYQVESKDYFIVEDLNEKESILYPNGTYVLKDEKLDNITWFRTNPDFGTIRKGENIYVYDFRRMKIWDDKNVFNQAKRRGTPTIGSSKDYIELHQGEDDVIYSISQKQVLVRGKKIRFYGDRDSYLIDVASDDLHSSLYTIDNNDNLRQLTDNHVISLEGYYCNGNTYGFLYDNGEYKARCARYVFDFRDKNVYLANGSYYQPSGEPISFLRDMNESKKIDRLVKENIDSIINESKIEVNEDGDSLIFLLNGNEIGVLVFNISDLDEIYSEYSDSVDDFDTDNLRFFNYREPIINIEDIWINRQFRGNKLFRSILHIGMEELKEKCNQFILRAYSDNGFSNEKLVEIYNDEGFIELQDTENDGIIMGLK